MDEGKVERGLGHRTALDLRERRLWGCLNGTSHEKPCGELSYGFAHVVLVTWKTWYLGGGEHQVM